ncbi:hypothetical protein [Synechococcus sp. PCC 6312]|uniref:hypothetical protein n=1 Tax=Synechococcus sp. (strain ATCC 27167 / PCC 6312) TaxID=195253 RepID=UPI00029EC8E3|nr:hypothetical protein [Synechococcus sp. PCC 6312]AFY61160.1 hypothetical protein Syn6312_2028 [Synechococcus sp. PCC 6312]
MSISRLIPRGFYQACLGVTLTTLTILTSATFAQAQTRRIQISDDTDIQALFDLVYRPGQDPQRFQLQGPEEKEAYALLTTILQTGTEVYLRSSQDGNYGSYNVTQDVLVLRPSAVAHWGIFLETLRHEGWHIVQACFAAGQGANTLIPVGLQVSRRTILNLRQNHSYAPEEIPVEAEAFEAENYPNLTLQGLQKECGPWLRGEVK